MFARLGLHGYIHIIRIAPAKRAKTGGSAKPLKKAYFVI
jgi:hypothetical protein